jgi:phosphoribosylaminoimidazole-succinocarboxamide synthase
MKEIHTAVSEENITRGALIAEGKTKRIFDVQGHPELAVVEYKNDITAFDNPDFTKQFATKAEYSNTTNAAVFDMLNAAGIPTGFKKKISATEFVTEKCTMIPLEVVARRYAVGSYLNRHPEFKKDTGQEPHRFDAVVAEFFLKTTKGGLKDSTGATIVEGLDPLKGEEDPFIQNPFETSWNLLQPKKQESEASLGRTIEGARVASPAQMREMERLVTQTFAVLEAFFLKNNFKFIDFKIEFGVTAAGTLVVADVIDNDSWRLRDQDWNDLSKQSFRDGKPLSEVEAKYGRVAELLETSRTQS